MAILDFIKGGDRRAFRWMLLCAVVAGLANALLMVDVNLVASLVAKGGRPTWGHAVAFVVVFAIFYQFDKLAVRRANIVVERLLKGLRLGLVDKLRCSELQVVEKLGRGNLYGAVAQATNQLSVTFPLLVENFQQSVLLLISLVYLAYLSLPALVVFVVATLVGYATYRRLKQDFGATLQEVARQEAAMLDAVGDIIDGGKELRLGSKRSESVFRAYQELSCSTEALLSRSGEHSISMVLLGSFIVYSLLAVVAFLFPRYMNLQGTVVFQLIPTILFCMSPLVRILSYSPMFVQSEIGLNAILRIERELEAGGRVEPWQAHGMAIKHRDFRRIGYSGLTFAFRDAKDLPVFTVGPVDLEIRRGETVFLVGGNGSGKSTIARLVAGLLRADAGRIAIDGVAVEGREIAGLRELFSAILGDFHLFDRLYGLEQVDPAEVTRLIGEMGLSGKVAFEEGRFTDLRLSTGERKRLALIAALLEDRPIYLFDEWSAEQDAHFREAFYARVIPGLKARGKTVIAVTHDDRFWHLADRVIKLDLGTVVWQRSGAELADGSA